MLPWRRRRRPDYVGRHREWGRRRASACPHCGRGVTDPPDGCDAVDGNGSPMHLITDGQLS